MFDRMTCAMDVGINFRSHSVDGVKILQAANDLLLFRKHEDVLRVCKLGIDRRQDVIFPHLDSAAHLEDNQNEYSDRSSQNSRLSNSHREAKREFLESLCILAMQAFAELDRWDQVQPFLLSCYGEIARLPPKIVLMCILLFSKVKNFTGAETFSSQWLKTQNGWSINQYCAVLELYVKRVFLTRGLWKDAREYIEVNSVLTPERKMQYLKLLTEMQQQEDRGGQESLKNGAKHASGSSFLLNFVQKLRSFFVSHLSPATATGLHRIQNLAIMSVFLYLLLFRTNTNIPTGASQVAVLWNSIVNVWRSLFAPFHVMLQQQA